MPNGDRTFKVILEVRNGALEETISGTEQGNANFKNKQLKRRDTKRKYKQAMKDPSKYLTTDMADGNHPTLVMRDAAGQGGKDDDVNFYCFEEFTISFRPDPEIEEDPIGPEAPFTKGGNEFTFDVSRPNPAANPPASEKFIAGPYKVAQNAQHQMFWKFSVETKSGLKLDPCIVTEA